MLQQSSLKSSSLPPPSGRVLLVGWDAADWKVILPMLDRGELPHIEHLIDNGVMGNLLTLRPVLSPMLWNSIATGQRPDRHGVHGFTEIDEVTQTVRAVGSTTRRCKALWNMVTQAGGRAHVVNWYASHPAEPINGICVSDNIARYLSDSLLPTGTVSPEELADKFARLRLRPDEIDEGTLKLFVPRLAEVDQETDKHLVTLARLLAESFTVHNVATQLVAEQPWDLAAVYYPGIDHFSHGFMNFHPPQLPGIPDKVFTLYSDVICSVYRLHDLFLGRLINLAGPGTNIVLLSDHGFHSDHARPRRIPAQPVGPAVQHRDHGILVVSGPNIRRDELIHGAGLLDIAPTVLTMLGLPVGDDMPGRVLVDAFIEPPKITTIDGWDGLVGGAGRHPADFVAPSQDQSLVLEQFAALGYVDLEEMQGPRSVDTCRRENAWSLAQSLVHAGQLEQAFEELIRLCLDWPDRGDFGIVLADVLRRLGHARVATQLVEALVRRNPALPAARYLLGISALEESRTAEAIEHLRIAAQGYADRSELHHAVGSGFLRMGRVADARAAFERALELDSHDASGWLGLAQCAKLERNWIKTESYALRTVGLDFQRPLAHYLMGIARLRLGRPADADLAFAVAERQAPAWERPRRMRERLRPWLPEVEGAEPMSCGLGTAPQPCRGYRHQAHEFLTPERQAMVESLTALYRDHVPDRRACAAEQATPALDLLLVSGLPRSGTSLMMQMLKSAGADILSDDKRIADLDNPQGYLEWEPIKHLPKQPHIMQQAEGKTVKVVSPLLRHLPPQHRYRVLFLDRPLDEILNSQLKMRDRRGKSEPPNTLQLRAALESHRKAALQFLRQARNFEVLVVPYPELIADPGHWSERIHQFVGDRISRPDRMAKVVRPELYRNRSKHMTSVNEENTP
jgi:predicted AlkP superfamily phosphohydrolase/phosphomutase/tetratricopeptide (TPR) repeat protein